MLSNPSVANPEDGKIESPHQITNRELDKVTSTQEGVYIYNYLITHSMCHHHTRQRASSGIHFYLQPFFPGAGSFFTGFLPPL